MVLYHYVIPSLETTKKRKSLKPNAKTIQMHVERDRKSGLKLYMYKYIVHRRNVDCGQ